MASRGCGSFQWRTNKVNKIEFRDFVTPWNFFAVFLREDSIVIKWLQEGGLQVSRMYCTRCDNHDMRLWKRSSSVDGVSWRCNHGHEISIRQNSFFEKSHISLRDIMLFVYEFLKHQTLWRTSQQIGFCYKSTAIDQSNFVRDLFRQYTKDVVFNWKFSGDVEVDESGFGRRSKNNMGARKGCRVWTVGIMERSSKRMNNSVSRWLSTWGSTRSFDWHTCWKRQPPFHRWLGRVWKVKRMWLWAFHCHSLMSVHSKVCQQRNRARSSLPHKQCGRCVGTCKETFPIHKWM